MLDKEILPMRLLDLLDTSSPSFIFLSDYNLLNLLNSSESLDVPCMRAWGCVLVEKRGFSAKLLSRL